jgi:hypothetical protein
LVYGGRMTTETTAPAGPPAQDHPFVLDSITETSSPVTPGEADWHRYVINQGHNQIVGYRRGSPRNVRQEIDQIVEQLNARRTVQSGRKHITLGSTGKKR